MQGTHLHSHIWTSLVTALSREAKGFSDPRIDKGMTFGAYFIKRQTEDDPAVLSESADPKEFRRAVRRAEKELKGGYLKRLYERFPKIQYGDIEEAFDEAMEDVKKGPARSESAIRKALRRRMEKILSGVNSRKRDAKKSLSCVQAVKASLKTGQSVHELMKKAERLLTNQESKVLRMCSEGKPVRKIAEEIGTSFPTAWRTLNSALDKIRMSHGMKPRHLDVRKRK